MRRRKFIAALGGTAIAWSFASRAQQAMPVIGLLSSASSHDYAPMIEAFRKSLGEAVCVYRKPYPGLLSEESVKLAR